MSTLTRLSPRKSVQAEVISPMSHRPDLLCDMVDDTAKCSGVRDLAEAIDEEVRLSLRAIVLYSW